MKVTQIIVLVFVLGFSAQGCAFLSITPDPEEASNRAPAQVDPDALREAREALNLKIDQARQNRDVVIGMPMKTVRNAWGNPSTVDFAGDSNTGNERWTYSDSLKSQWGFGHSLVVYFERGQVVGWETH